ncbi:MAG: Ku protein [Chryseobacterium sp.]|nr:MAG: Ku protein [Chryseobacterium sp.]
MRAIWNGAIGFGLVNIPVKLYTATEESNVDLDMLDKSDYSHIRYKRVNENTGKEVKWENIVKGYNLEGEYIVLTDEDFAAVNPEKSKILAIEQFVHVDEVDSVYFESAYFIEPQKNGEDAYRLMLEALLDTGMAGVGTFILREKELIGMVRPYNEEILMLNRMRYSDNIRDYKDLKLPAEKKVKPAELKMAEALIEQLSEPFDPSLYKNTYADDLMEIIERKAAGKRPRRTKKAETPTAAVDLMAQLKASLEASKSQGKKVS